MVSYCALAMNASRPLVLAAWRCKLLRDAAAMMVGLGLVIAGMQGTKVMQVMQCGNSCLPHDRWLWEAVAQHCGLAFFGHRNQATPAVTCGFMLALNRWGV